MENKEAKGINALFNNRRNFIIIGLTGRTGAGCSTVAELLTKEFKELNIRQVKNNDFLNNEERKNYIVYKYAKENWKAFKKIQVSDIITFYILDSGLEKFKSYTYKIIDEMNKERPESKIEIKDEKINEISKIFKKFREEYSEVKSEEEVIKENIDNAEKDIDDFIEFFLEKMPNHTKNIRKILNEINNNLYTKIYQYSGNNLRKSGNVYDEKFNPDKMFTLSIAINKIIKILREKDKILKKRGESKGTLVVIDAFRSPYEATFFKDRYSAFYLFSVNTTYKIREQRLKEKEINIEDLDKIESPKETTGESLFWHQNIPKCLEMSDVYLNNADINLDNIKLQLVRYISLIMHPGLVTPTKLERTMQIAYNAKVSSGCLSRQVGAVITDKDFAIKSIGWNDVPKGQVPCNLKSIENLVERERFDMSSFSNFEKENLEFKKSIKKINVKINEIENNIDNKDIVQGRSFPYCFKDIYNGGVKKGNNQTMTRSLHAEENAFLQISKYGGIGLEGGNLFTTASPCELCAKKAYQIGIQNIYYIDLYPGISEENILNNGKCRPNLILFEGAIGRAYTQFYTPIIPYKDEEYMLLGDNFKNISGNINEDLEKFKKEIDNMDICGNVKKDILAIAKKYFS